MIFLIKHSDFRNSFSILKTTLINSGNVIDSKIIIKQNYIVKKWSYHTIYTKKKGKFCKMD